MTTHRYERRAILGDYARGGLGLVVTGLPLIVTPVATGVAVVLGGFAVLFGVYLLRTWVRAVSTVELDGDGIRSHGPRGVTIPWDELQTLELRYFSTRRDKEAGWMQMTVRGINRSIAIESALEGFDDVVRHASLVARRNDLALSDATKDNLRALGLIESSSEMSPPIPDPRHDARRGGF